MKENLFDMKSIGTRIRLERERKKISREKLSEMSDISTQFLAEIEGGRKGMTINTLIKLSEALNLSFDYIIYGEENSQIDLNLSTMLRKLNHKQLKAIKAIIEIIFELTE